MTMMTQCRLRHHSGSTQDAWIDSKLATPERVIRIRVDGEWQEGWRVVSIGSTMDSKVVQARERDFKNHRIATDV
jgi:hypothetical protein